MSPTLTCQATISASVVPSPISGTLTTRRATLALQRLADALGDALRPGEIGPFERMRIGRVQPGHPHDRRLEMVEAMLLHQRRQFGAEAAGAGRLVRDDAAPGLLDRGDDGVEVERQQACADRSPRHRRRPPRPPPARHAPSCRRRAPSPPARRARSPPGRAARCSSPPAPRSADAATTAPPGGRDGRRTGRCRAASARKRPPGRHPRSR